MGLYLVYLINGAITAVAAIAVFAYWVANRKRIAAETIGRAEEQALRILKDAERDAESRKKEALLELYNELHFELPDPPTSASIATISRKWTRLNRDMSGAWDTTGMLLDNLDEVQATAARLPYVDGF